MVTDRVVPITSDNFEEQVLNASLPVLIDFWAVWCSPCKAVAPIISELSEDYAGKVIFGKINVDEMPDLAHKYNIMSIPTFILFKNGVAAERLIGARPKDDMKKLLDQYL